MEQQTKNYLFFAFSIALAAGIYVWSYPLNKGTAKISIGMTDYLIVSNLVSISCKTDPCLITLKAGSHDLNIQKDQYFPKHITVTIARGQTTDALIQMEKIPSLIEQSSAPETARINPPAIPDFINQEESLALSWDNDFSVLAFIDKNDEKLKVWDGKKLGTITTLKNLRESFELHWGKNDNFMVGIEGKNLYFIERMEASRNKIILPFEPHNLIWSPNSLYLLVNDENLKVYQLKFSNNQLNPLELEIDLSQAVWIEENTLIHYDYNSQENKTMIQEISLETEESDEIMVKYNFPISRIAASEEREVYFYNSEIEKWHLIDY